MTKFYVSHNPSEEEGARRLAKKLEKEGHEVIVAADARPHKDKPHDEHDLEAVRKIIGTCDAVIMYVK